VFLLSSEDKRRYVPMVSHLVLPQQRQKGDRFSRFQLMHVSQSAAVVIYGDVCKETCKTPPPETCKLECHSGSPFMDMQEEVPDMVACEVLGRIGSLLCLALCE
jgi:hypothetical protein